MNSIFHEKNVSEAVFDCLFDRMFWVELAGERIERAMVIMTEGSEDSEEGFERDCNKVKVFALTS